MPVWKRNLYVCWFGIFVSGLGLSQIAPILPLYIQHLGVADPAAVARLSGIAFGVTFIVSAILSPVWGYLADRVGRKPMILRASLGMALVIGAMGLAPNVYVLIALRVLQGAITGYATACTTLIATQTDREHIGWALGLLSTAGITGSLLGPTLGGWLGEHFGFEVSFFLIGAFMLVSFFTSLLFVQESFVREDRKTAGIQELWRDLPEKGLTINLCVVFFIMSMAMYTIEPIITVYISQLTQSGAHIALIAGVVFSASGLANILSAPGLGKLSDRVGAQKVILVCLIFAGVMILPQAYVKNPWQLMALRFALGLAIGGLTPSVNTLLKRITPDRLTGRIMGFSMAAGYLGIFVGAVLGGQVAAVFGFRSVFFLTGTLLGLSALLVFFTIYRRMGGRAPEQITLKP